ncbi:MAG TPA: hypothetical protein DIC23_05985 [Planctomycetaceae bacterium]|nr:hypothetical protein [Planctomycetaceae bacterium]
MISAVGIVWNTSWEAGRSGIGLSIGHETLFYDFILLFATAASGPPDWPISRRTRELRWRFGAVLHLFFLIEQSHNWPATSARSTRSRGFDVSRSECWVLSRWRRDDHLVLALR